MIFVGLKGRKFVEKCSQDSAFIIRTLPRYEHCSFPIYFEILEGICQISEEVVGSDLRKAAAPYFEELSDKDLIPYRNFQWDQIAIPENDDDEVMFSKYLAQKLRTSEHRFLIVIHTPEALNASCATVVRYLLDLANDNAIDIWLQTSTNKIGSSRFADQVKNSIILNEVADSTNVTEIETPLVSILNRCKALPLDVFDRLATEEEEACVEIFEGPDGNNWVVPRSNLNCLDGACPTKEFTILADTIFEMWSPLGWGYLYRAAFAMQFCNRANLTKLCLPVVQSYIGLSRTAAFQYTKQIVNHQEFGSYDVNFRLFCLMTNGRLATRSAIDGGYARAAAMMYQALEICNNIEIEARIRFHLANVLANTRTNNSLKLAKIEYSSLAKMIPEIENSDSRFKSRIEMLNGLALVEYLNGNSHQSLKLEMRALNFSGSDVKIAKSLRDWSKRLLYQNLSTLLQRRFSDTKHSRILLSINNLSPNPKQLGRSFTQYIECLLDDGDFDEINLECKNLIYSGRIFQAMDRDRAKIYLLYIISNYKTKRKITDEKILEDAFSIFRKLNLTIANDVFEYLIDVDSMSKKC